MWTGPHDGMFLSNVVQVMSPRNAPRKFPLEVALNSRRRSRFWQGTVGVADLEKAKSDCTNAACGGLTFDPATKLWSLRQSSDLSK